MGSLNPELIEYAEALGKKIPNLDECIATVKGYDQVSTPATPEVEPIAESSASENTTTVQANFCRKCGAQLQADSGFCHKCGTEIVK
jgi:ribosomal protein L40E